MLKKIALSTILLFSINNYSMANNFEQYSVVQKNSTSILNSEKSEIKNEDNWTKTLDEYISERKFASAYRLTLDKPAASLIGRLRPWAEKDVTVAQWLYASALYKEGRLEESAKWTYIAFFFTRYDASLCTNKQALNLEKVIVDSYSDVVLSSRSNKEMINIAVPQALRYLKNYNASSLTTRDPDWICDMVDNTKGKQLLIPTDFWAKIYKERLSQFIKATTGEEYNAE